MPQRCPCARPLPLLRNTVLLLACWLTVLVSSVRGDSEAIRCPAGPSTQTVAYGTVASCGIEFPQQDESDEFEFEAAAGEIVILILRRNGTSGGVCMELENPFGTKLAGPNCTGTAQPTRLDWIIFDNGTHTVDVYGQTGTPPVQYTLTIERLTPASPAAKPLILDQARGGDINPAGDLDFFSFQGTAGQTVRVSLYRVGTGGTPCFDALTPSGGQAAPSVCDPSVAQSTFTLTTSGAFSLMVYSQNHSAVMTYGIHLRCISGCTPQPPPDLRQCVGPPSLQVSALTGAAPVQRFVAVGNPDVPNCTVSAVASFSAAAQPLNGGTGWLSVSPTSGTFYPGAENTVAVSFNPNGAPGPGTYQGTVQITIASLNTIIKVPVTLTVNNPRPELSLSWTAFAFQTVEFTAAPPPQTLRIYNAQPGTLDWQITNEEGGPLPSWITISPPSGTAGHLRGQGSPVTISVNPNGLTANPTSNNVFTALLRVSSPNAVNSPQFVSISFHVVRITAAPVPLLTAYGMLFEATEGGSAPPPQEFKFSNTGGGSIDATFTARTFSGGNWLSLSKTSARVTTATTPEAIRASANPAGLPPGRYRGRITAKFAAKNSTGADVSRPDQDIDVTLVVSPAVAPLTAQRSDQRAADCAPTQMLLVGTTIGNGLNVPVSFPVALLAQVIDDCSQAVTGATAVAVADGLTIPLTEVGGGLYSGNWTPQRINAVAPVSFTIFHPSFPTAQQNFTVSAVPSSGGTVLPSLLPQGVVEAAGLSTGRPLAPGGVISLFGANLAPPGTLAVSNSAPLTRNLAGTRVRIGGQDAPLYFVSPGQINAQLPFEVQPGETVAVVVNAGGRLTMPQTYQISAAQPGIFLTGAGSAVLDENNALVNAQNPARRGQRIKIFSTGLGKTTPQVESGAGAPSSSSVQVPVSVTIGSAPATVEYQGLAPDFVGLYQVTVLVPPSAPTGPAVPLVITQDGIPSNPDLPATLPVAP